MNYYCRRTHVASFPMTLLWVSICGITTLLSAQENSARTTQKNSLQVIPLGIDNARIEIDPWNNRIGVFNYQTNQLRIIPFDNLLAGNADPARQLKRRMYSFYFKRSEDRDLIITQSEGLFELLDGHTLERIKGSENLPNPLNPDQSQARIGVCQSPNQNHVLLTQGGRNPYAMVFDLSGRRKYNDDVAGWAKFNHSVFAWTSNGHLLETRGPARVYDFEEFSRAPGSTEPIIKTTFDTVGPFVSSPTGRWLMTRSGIVELDPAKAENGVVRHRKWKKIINPLMFTNDGNWIVARDDDSLLVVDPISLETIHKIPLPEELHAGKPAGHLAGSLYGMCWRAITLSDGRWLFTHNKAIGIYDPKDLNLDSNIPFEVTLPNAPVRWNKKTILTVKSTINSIKLKESPKWVRWKEEKLICTPTKDDLGTHSLTWSVQRNGKALETNTSIRVGLPQWKLGFPVAGATLSVDGKSALVWSDGKLDGLTGKRVGAKLALCDSETGRILAETDTHNAIINAEFAGNRVIVLYAQSFDEFRRPIGWLVKWLDRRDLQMKSTRRLQRAASELWVLGERLLTIWDGPQLLTAIDTTTNQVSWIEKWLLGVEGDAKSTIHRLNRGWLIAGLRLDESLERVEAVINPIRPGYDGDTLNSLAHVPASSAFVGGAKPAFWGPQVAGSSIQSDRRRSVFKRERTSKTRTPDSKRVLSLVVPSRRKPAQISLAEGDEIVPLHSVQRKEPDVSLQTCRDRWLTVVDGQVTSGSFSELLEELGVTVNPINLQIAQDQAFYILDEQAPTKIRIDIAGGKPPYKMDAKIAAIGFEPERLESRKNHQESSDDTDTENDDANVEIVKVDGQTIQIDYKALMSKPKLFDGALFDLFSMQAQRSHSHRPADMIKTAAKGWRNTYGALVKREVVEGRWSGPTRFRGFPIGVPLAITATDSTGASVQMTPTLVLPIPKKMFESYCRAIPKLSNGLDLSRIPRGPFRRTTDRPFQKVWAPKKVTGMDGVIQASAQFRDWIERLRPLRNNESWNMSDWLAGNPPESRERERGWRISGEEQKLKTIAAATLSYVRDFGHLPPPALVDATGRPLMSWRVMLLPYLGEDVVFKLDLNLPWDDPINAELLEAIPSAFNSGFDRLSNFHCILGPESAFPGDRLIWMDEIKDAKMDTLLYYHGWSERVDWLAFDLYLKAPPKDQKGVWLRADMHDSSGVFADQGIRIRPSTEPQRMDPRRFPEPRDADSALRPNSGSWSGIRPVPDRFWQ